MDQEIMPFDEPEIVKRGRLAWELASDEILILALFTTIDITFFNYVKEERLDAWIKFQWFYWADQFFPPNY